MDRATSTHILDLHLPEQRIFRVNTGTRREGTATVRTAGKSPGDLCRVDVPSSQVHAVVGHVIHGIELVKLAKERDIIAVTVNRSGSTSSGSPLVRHERSPHPRCCTRVR